MEGGVSRRAKYCGIGSHVSPVWAVGGWTCDCFNRINSPVHLMSQCPLNTPEQTYAKQDYSPAWNPHLCPQCFTALHRGGALLDQCAYASVPLGNVYSCLLKTIDTLLWHAFNIRDQVWSFYFVESGLLRSLQQSIHPWLMVTQCCAHKYFITH